MHYWVIMLQLWTNVAAEQGTCNPSLLQPNKLLICKVDSFSRTSWCCVLLWWDFSPLQKKQEQCFHLKTLISETEGIFQPLAFSRQQRRNFNFIEKLAQPTHIPISQNSAGVHNCFARQAWWWEHSQGLHGVSSDRSTAVGTGMRRKKWSRDWLSQGRVSVFPNIN